MDAAPYSEYILETAIHKISSVQSLASHLTNHSRGSTRHVELSWRGNGELIRVLLWTPTHSHNGVPRPAKKISYISSLRTLGAGLTTSNLRRLMGTDNERVKRICVAGKT